MKRNRDNPCLQYTQEFGQGENKKANKTGGGRVSPTSSYGLWTQTGPKVGDGKPGFRL